MIDKGNLLYRQEIKKKSKILMSYHLLMSFLPATLVCCVLIIGLRSFLTSTQHKEGIWNLTMIISLFLLFFCASVFVLLGITLMRGAHPNPCEIYENGISLPHASKGWCYIPFKEIEEVYMNRPIGNDVQYNILLNKGHLNEDKKEKMKTLIDDEWGGKLGYIVIVTINGVKVFDKNKIDIDIIDKILSNKIKINRHDYYMFV